MQIVCLYGVCNVHCAFSHLLSQVSFIIIMHAWYGMASNIQIFNCRDKNREEKVSPIKVPLVAAENIYMHKQQAQARPTPSTFGKRKNQLPYLFITIRSYIIIIVRCASSWKQHAYVLKNTYETSSRTAIDTSKIACTRMSVSYVASAHATHVGSLLVMLVMLYGEPAAPIHQID